MIKYITVRQLSERIGIPAAKLYAGIKLGTVFSRKITDAISGRVKIKIPKSEIARLKGLIKLNE